MYYKEVLPNGLRIVYEKMPYVQSVSIGLWVGAGSRFEDARNNGISHFIEHMLFKGTSRRSARDIAEEIDNVGGQLNAFTGKECTCYYAKVLNTHLDLALDILSDMIFASSFSPEAIEKEKKVVLEEINMYEDTPEELVHDLYASTIFKGHPLGYPILGRTDTVKGFKRDDLLKYMKQNYRPDNTVISVAGNIEYSELKRLVSKYFGNWEGSVPAAVNHISPLMNFDISVRKKETEQVHFCLGFRGFDQKDERLYSLMALNSLIGGGMSSRLFQKIREDMGLVYSVYSYPSTYSDVGLMTIYAGTNPQQLDMVINEIMEELLLIKKEGINDKELNRIKEQMKGNFVMSAESTGSRMASLGKSELLLGRTYSKEEILRKIDDISIPKVVETVEAVIQLDSMAAALLGNVSPDSMSSLEMIQCCK